MKYIYSIFEFLKNINNNYSQLFLFVISLITFFILYKEFIQKRRPYIFPELTFQPIAEDWYFHFILKNAGDYPAQVKVNKAQLKIGDEIYPTEFSSEMLIPTGEVQKLLPIGHIKKLGRDKIINSEYVSNRVEIDFKISSKGIGDKTYKYNTSLIYSIDVKNSTPIIQIISEKFS